MLVGTGVAISTLSGAAATTSAIAAGGLWANNKNKKVAKEAEEQILKIRVEIAKLNKIDQSVNSIKKETSYFEETIKPIFYKMSDYNITDYKQFDSKQLADIKTLLDNTLALSKVLDKEVN